jgi:hypothetical protein
MWHINEPQPSGIKEKKISHSFLSDKDPKESHSKFKKRLMGCQVFAPFSLIEETHE